MDWSTLDMVVFAASAQTAQGLVCLPSDNVLRKVEAAPRNGAFALASGPLAGKATSTVRLHTQFAR
jgi:alpha-D-xyloside xylohydrolase